MALEIEIYPDADARRGAEHVARQAGAAIADHGRVTFTVSGGHTPWAMFGHLAAEPIWLITGADKGDAPARLRAGAHSMRAGRISTADALVIADEAAAGGAAR